MRQQTGIRIILIVAILSIVGAIVVRWVGLGSLFGLGYSALERWCGEQIRVIADDLLEPTLTFDDFSYEYPATLTFRKVRLTDKDVVCLEAATMRLILRDIPVRGKPIVIDTVELTEPVTRLVGRSDGTLAGFSNFLKPSGARRHADGGSSIPSDFLAVRKMTIKDGAFRWQSMNGTIMELDDLDFEFGGRPDDEPGWYDLDATLVRAPIIDLDLTGRFQLDQFLLELEKLALVITLDHETKRQLPPALQTVLAKFELEGELTVKGAAKLPFASPADTTFNLNLQLDDAHLAHGRLNVPLQQLTMDLALSDNLLTSNAVKADVFGGQVTGSGSINLAKDSYCEVTVAGRDLRLERGFRETTEVRANLAGAVTLDGTVSVSLEAFPAELEGSGEVSVKDGRLWGDSLYRAVMEKAGQTKTDKDNGSLDFVLKPDRAEFQKIRVVGDSTAAHGDGELHFDKRINFRFNTGPLERIEEALGPIGSLLELASDRVLTYHVTGTWAKPEFNVRPLGLGAGREKENRPPN